jgi:hypothetical protein
VVDIAVRVWLLNSLTPEFRKKARSNTTADCPEYLLSFIVAIMCYVRVTNVMPNLNNSRYLASARLSAMPELSGNYHADGLTGLAIYGHKTTVLLYEPVPDS